MNHNSTAMLAIDPRRRNDSVYQKTLMLNDYYLSDGKGGKPLGNVQLLGKIDGNMLAANVKLLPRFALELDGRPCRRLVPDVRGSARPESRIMVDGDRSCCNGGAPTCSRWRAWRKVDARNARLRLSDRAVQAVRSAARRRTSAARS